MKEDNKWDQDASLLTGEKTTGEAAPDAQAIWSKTTLREDNFEPDVDAGWKQFQMKVRMRSSRQPNNALWVRVAAVFLLLLTASLILYNYTHISSDPVEIIAEKSIHQVELPDGSIAWLNKGSRLTYSNDFSLEHRLVELSGEAFFDVVKMDGKRFTVLTETSRTEVLGTSFNVIAKSGEPAKVQVASGKVAVTPLKTKTTILLNPGEEVSIPKENERKIVAKPIEDQNYRAWQNKQLVFMSTNVPELAKTIAEYFEVSIEVDEALKNCQFTSTFKDPRLEEVLKVVALTGDFEITESKTGYFITGKSCKE